MTFCVPPERKSACRGSPLPGSSVPSIQSASRVVSICSSVTGSPPRSRGSQRISPAPLRVCAVPIRWATCRGGLVVPQHLLGHRGLVYLGGPVGKPHHRRAGDHPEEWHLVGDTQCSVYLHCAPGDIVQHGRHGDLHRRDVLAHLFVVVVFVDLPGGVEHHEPKLQQLCIRVGDVALHELLVRQAAALGLATECTFTHHVQCPLRHADGPHRVVDAPAAETGLCDDECLPLAAQQCLGGHPDVVIVNQCVRALALGLSVQAEVAHDVDTGGVGGDQEHRHALVGTDFGIRHHHHDQERRCAGVGGEELPPLITQSSPSRTADVVNRVGSAPACGSVIE